MPSITSMAGGGRGIGHTQKRQKTPARSVANRARVATETQPARN